VKTTIYKTLLRKQEIEQQQTHKKRGWTEVLWKGNQFLFH